MVSSQTHRDNPVVAAIPSKASHILCAEAHIARVGVCDHHPNAGVAKITLAVEEYYGTVLALEYCVLHPTPDMRITPKPAARLRDAD